MYNEPELLGLLGVINGIRADIRRHVPHGVCRPHGVHNAVHVLIVESPKREHSGYHLPNYGFVQSMRTSCPSRGAEGACDI